MVKFFIIILSILLLNNAALSKLSEAEEVFFNKIKFRPIFKDLNGKRTGQSYIKLACLNPMVSKETLKEVDEKTLIISKKGVQEWEGYVIADNSSDTAIEALKRQACLKYAKF